MHKMKGRSFKLHIKDEKSCSVKFGRWKVHGSSVYTDLTV